VIFSFLYYNMTLNNFSLALLGLVGLMLILFDIRVGIYMEVLLYPFLPDILNLLFMIFLVGVYVFNIVFKKVKPLTKPSIIMPIILYIIFITINTITSNDPIGSFRDLSKHLTSIGFIFVLINSIRSKKDFNILVVLLIISATLTAVYGLYQLATGNVVMEDKWVDEATNPDLQTRIYSVFGNPNIFAEYLIMLIPISLSSFWFSKRIHKKALFLITSLVLVLALVLTMSRGGWIGFAFGIFVFILLVEKRLLLLPIPAAIGGLFILPDAILNRLMSILNFADSSNDYRIRMWKFTLEVIRDNWLVGVGFGHLPFREAFGRYTRTMVTYHAHNTYLETMAEMGILGFIVFISFLFVLFKYTIKKLIKGNDEYTKIITAGILSGLAAVLVQGLVENILYMPRIIISFWILVGLLITLINLKDQAQKVS
ncbi:MAG: polymerase, partial [Tissierellia bacterium]|nr:polymerase [Tissierellia bacterium]